MRLHNQVKIRFIHCQKTLYIRNLVLLYHILKEKGYLPVECRMCRDFTSPKNVIDSLISIRLNWRRLSRVVQKDDTLIIQYPFGDYKTNLKQVKTKSCCFNS